MIETQEFILREELTRGLRPASRSVRNSASLLKCNNARPTRFGLKSNSVVTNPFGTATLDWPFPQIFRGKDITLSCERTAIYEVDDSGLPWARTQISTFDFNSPGTSKEIPSGGQWHFLDYFNTRISATDLSRGCRT